MAREQIELRCGELIDRAMRRAGMTQSELARASGVQRPMICRILNSKRGANIATVFRLIDACGFELHLKLHVSKS